MDPKGRVPVPAQFRKIFQKDAQDYVDLILKPGSQCLRGYTLPAYNHLRSKIDAIADAKQRMNARAFLLSNQARCEFDAQGRVLIPGELRQKVKLAGEVTFIGCDDSFEIWDSEAWRREEARLEADFTTDMVAEVFG